MTVTTASLWSLFQTALIAPNATVAGQKVFLPREWSTAPDLVPAIFLGPPTDRPAEHKANAGGRTGGPQFNVTGIVRVIGRLVAPASGGDAGAAVLLAALGDFQRQIEVAVIDSDAIRPVIQQYVSVDVQMRIKADGEVYVGEVEMDFALEFYQAQEDFAPIATTPIEQMAIYADLVNIYSPTGMFNDTPFNDAIPADRTSGPDGRAEGELLIQIDALSLDFRDPNDIILGVL